MPPKKSWYKSTTHRYQQEVLVDVMQTDYGYTHDPDGYLLLKITQLIELLGIRHCVGALSDAFHRVTAWVPSYTIWVDYIHWLLQP